VGKGSGEGSRGRGGRAADGESRLEELDRRSGATPFAEWSEFIDAFLSSAGVADRDGVPLAAKAPLRGLRNALPGRGVLGDLAAVGFRGLEWLVDIWGLGERGGFAGEGDGDGLAIERRLRDWRRERSLSAGALSL